MLKETIAVISASGFLGAKVSRLFKEKSFKVVDTFFPKPEGIEGFELDITDLDAIRAFFEKVSPTIVINCSAVTAVDWCEEHREECFKVNVSGVENLAEACKENNAKLVHFSSAFVFSGRTEKPYTEEDEMNPVNTYSESKAEAEKVVSKLENFIIIRTTDLYGFNKPGEKNFVTWVLQNLKEGKGFGVVNDQFSQPALIDDVAKATLDLVNLYEKGIFHIFGTDYLSKYDFAVKIALAFGFDPKLIKPISTAESPLKATRPMKLPMNLEKATRLGIKTVGIDAKQMQV